MNEESYKAERARQLEEGIRRLKEAFDTEPLPDPIAITNEEQYEERIEQLLLLIGKIAAHQRAEGEIPYYDHDARIDANIELHVRLRPHRGELEKALADYAKATQTDPLWAAIERYANAVANESSCRSSEYYFGEDDERIDLEVWLAHREVRRAMRSKDG